MKSGSCQEYGIAITILSCSQPHHEKKVIRTLLLMTAGHVYCSRYGSCKKAIRQRNFFTENHFIIPTWKILFVLRVGPIRRHKLCIEKFISTLDLSVFTSERSFPGNK